MSQALNNWQNCQRGGVGGGGFVVKIRQQASTFLSIRNLYKELRDGDRQFYPISKNRNISITLSGNSKIFSEGTKICISFAPSPFLCKKAFVFVIPFAIFHIIHLFTVPVRNHIIILNLKCFSANIL